MDDFTRTQPIGDQIRELAAHEDPPPLTPGDLARLDRIAAALRDEPSAGAARPTCCRGNTAGDIRRS